ncbi:MAG: helix-turn-helix transcriptional regulator [Patescibacteria group bacterium]
MHSHLKEFRAQKGLSQGQLAEKLGVTRQTINAIEQSKYQPSLSLAYDCAKFFGTTIEELFTYK